MKTLYMVTWHSWDKSIVLNEGKFKETKKLFILKERVSGEFNFGTQFYKEIIGVSLFETKEDALNAFIEEMNKDIKVFEYKIEKCKDNIIAAKNMI